MKKLNEDKALPAEDERLIHADSGEGGQLDLSPDKEEINKKVTKELEDRVEYVEDEINNADTPKPEATTDSGKGVEGLTKPAKIKEKLTLEEPSDILSERLILDEGDMDEAIPKNAIPAYKRHYNPNNTGTNALDYQNSNLTEISPEDALKMVKAGEGGNLRMLIGNQLVKLGNRNYGDNDFRNQWVGTDRAYTTSRGNTVTDTKNMPAKHLFTIADKIYVADEKLKDRDLINARAENPESKNASSDLVVPTRSPVTTLGSDSYNRNYSNVRGSGSSWGSTTSARELNRYVRGNSDATPGSNRANSAKDAKARLRYLSSERDLQKPAIEYNGLKQGLRGQQRELSRAEDELTQAKEGGSPETRSKRAQVHELEAQLKSIRRQLALLNYELEDANENDAEAINAAQARFDRAKGALDQAQARISQLLGRNR